MRCPAGRTGFNIGAVTVIPPKKRAQDELYTTGKDAESFFDLLKKQKDESENEPGHSLGREELPDGQDSRIAVYCDNVDAENREDRENRHEGPAKRVNRPHRVFSKRVREMNPEDWNGS